MGDRLHSLSRIVRVVLWGVVTGGLLAFARQWSEPTGTQTGSQPEGLSSGVRLYRDPMCGIYVSPEISVKSERSGQITHFCSAECRERASQTARASEQAVADQAPQR
jgi:YHS domain-containing protein